MMKTLFCLISISCFTILTGFCQEKLLTVAEKTDFKSTSEHKDVIDFIGHLKESSGFIRVENIATSAEGREIPLLIIGDPLPDSPASLKNDDRVVVYIQGNIHAGEVEGKEASLMFARDILKNRDAELLRNVIILICPLLNPDGNDKISTANRTSQNGPVNGVGVRHNGQYLDLNRDAMKAEAPEVRGLLTKVFNRWDPEIFMDCHTTNGSYHVEPVTFTWMVNPNGDKELISYMRDTMMPEISDNLRKKYRVENCFYGEFYDLMDPLKGWVMEAAGPRYMTNYVGLRNRLSILNENYVYADFKTRVQGCYHLIHSLFDYAKSNSSAIKKMVAEADKRAVSRGAEPSLSDSFAIEYAVRPVKKPVTIKAYVAEPAGEIDGWRSFRNTGIQRNVTVPYYIEYYPVRSVPLPSAYLITVNDGIIINLLKTHGIRVEKLAGSLSLPVERFDISVLKGSSRLNQGHYMNSVEGRFTTETKKFSPGTLVVRMDQPLSNLCAYLLEPQSDDGLLTWNYFDRYLVPQWGSGYYPYPVYKLMNSFSPDQVALLKVTPEE